MFRRLQDLQSSDADWRAGRSALHVYWAGEDVQRISAQAYTMFQQSNALAPRAFPGLQQMEQEIIAMSLPLWQAPVGAGAAVTSGGTESIILAMQAIRHRAREQRPALARPVVLAGRSAHPAWEKAAGLLGMHIHRVPLGSDFCMDPGAVAGAVTGDVAGIVGSAPSLPFGTVDPIPALGALAQKYDLWLHVDACLGGYLAPFVRAQGHAVPEYDLSVPGVRSLSADLHKYGYAPKGNALIAYRDAEDLARNRFYFDNWPKGGYETRTLAGTRSGGALAAAWAVMTNLGEKGYKERAGQIMQTRARIEAGLRDIGGFELMGKQPLGVLSFMSPGRDAFISEDRLGRLGWYTSRTAHPVGLQMTLTPIHARSTDRFLEDLERVVHAQADSSKEVAISTY
ncbi:aminotransferase class V-fold PLP-dependent enzyme [uncultured Roseobacter sp.]|uniref:pyridoxal phosphate-dependent decarboxylase family protein n=1 Tax=uncultured Roseobacter sp. TaxID=114847 RepID=UPI00260ABE9A|nr:aminotransferase class V-fold PLP-dependent enzyme [uncultured Roseobacter sp.]